ncbi:MAG: acyltransferase [Catenulispora sp.]|nr:acyltransferase [Catenulispora sp.]
MAATQDPMLSGPVAGTGTRLPAWTRVGYRGTLAEVFSGRDNGVGFLRFALAMSVVVSHSGILGFGRPDLLGEQFRNQQALGGLAVAGFFILSGMLITRSARRTTFGRFCWHRALRIFPGLWVCLAVTAFGVAPLIAYHEWGTLHGFFARDSGPFGYVSNNMWTGIRQSGIHDLLASTTPWGRLTRASAFDGALWSLCYELLCYMVVGILLVSGVLRTARRLVPLLAALLYVRILMDFRFSHGWGGGVMAHYDRFETTLFGTIDLRWVVYLGFLFLAAGAMELYKERIPIHDGLGVAALAICLGTLLFGGWFAIGYPVLAYVMVWAACRLPRRLHWVGRKNDYSYGIYIYGLVGQQVLASFGWNRWGYWPYLALSVSLAWTAAFLSWHLVEKHFLKLKNWTPARPVRPTRWVRVRRAAGADGGASAGVGVGVGIGVVVPEPSSEPAAAPAV